MTNAPGSERHPRWMWTDTHNITLKHPMSSLYTSHYMIRIYIINRFLQNG